MHYYKRGGEGSVLVTLLIFLRGEGVRNLVSFCIGGGACSSFGTISMLGGGGDN